MYVRKPRPWPSIFQTTAVNWECPKGASGAPRQCGGTQPQPPKALRLEDVLHGVLRAVGHQDVTTRTPCPWASEVARRTPIGQNGEGGRAGHARGSLRGPSDSGSCPRPRDGGRDFKPSCPPASGGSLTQNGHPRRAEYDTTRECKCDT